jgi:hypothetical protein
VKVTFVLYDPQLPKHDLKFARLSSVTCSFENEDEYETLAE